MSIKSSDIGKLRLESHQLCETTLNTAQDMVSWFGAVQGQEYAQTKWGLGLRLPHLTDNEIENELSEGKILRTHLLRPTWHFVSSDDIQWLLMLTAPRVNAANTHMYRKLELDNTVFNRCNNILTKLLKGNKQFTRAEINDEFKKNKIIAHGHRLSYIMMHSELDGIICSGARQGNQFTYSFLADRIKTGNRFNKDEALAELTKRYFKSRGPATIKDFSTWSGLTLTECKNGLKAVESNFEREIINENEYYFSKEISSNKKMPQDIYLLPIYDEFIMGYKDRSTILEYKNSLKNSPLFHYDCMIIFEGQIIGTWKRTLAKKTIDMEYVFFRPLNKSQENAFNIAIHRYEEYLNMTLHKS